MKTYKPLTHYEQAAAYAAMIVGQKITNTDRPIRQDSLRRMYDAKLQERLAELRKGDLEKL